MINMPFDIETLQAFLTADKLPDLEGIKPGRAIKSREEIRRDWLMLRRGKFTASDFHRLMAYQGKSEMPKGGQSYALEKALELLTEFEPGSYMSQAMQWGIDHEPEAVQAFVAHTGHDVASHGAGQIFLRLGDDVGGTPDGLIPSERSGLEVKCPGSKTHLEYIGISDGESLKKIANEYYWQVQGLMMINLSDKWYFVSFDPRFINPKHRLHIAVIIRNETDIHDLRIRLDMAIEYRNEILERLR